MEYLNLSEIIRIEIFENCQAFWQPSHFEKNDFQSEGVSIAIKPSLIGFSSPQIHK